ncbi:MAG: DEAD/DEAH box helicase [Thermodesulfobacteriota bacterium]
MDDAFLPTGSPYPLLLTCCALLERPKNVGEIAACLASAGCVREPSALRSQLAALVGRGLLAPDLTCPEQSRESIARDAASFPWFPGISNAIDLLDRQGDRASPVTIKRQLRLAFLHRDPDRFNRALLSYLDKEGGRPAQDPIVAICSRPFDCAWLRGLPPAMLIYALHRLYLDALSGNTSLEPLLACLRQIAADGSFPELGRPSVRYLLTACLLHRGQLAEAVALGTVASGPSPPGIAGWLQFCGGDPTGAILRFDEDLLRLRQEQGQKSAFFSGMEGVLYVLAQLHAGDYRRLPALRSLLHEQCIARPSTHFQKEYLLLKDLTEFLEQPGGTRPFHILSRQPQRPLTTYFRLLATYWLQGSLAEEDRASLAKLRGDAAGRGNDWLALECDGLLSRLEDNHPGSFPGKLEAKTGMIPFSSVIRHEEPWQLALKALSLPAETESSSGEGHHRRLAWFLSLDGEGQVLNMAAKEQKLSKNGSWSKGRVVALKKIGTLSFLTEQDRRVCAKVTVKNAPWGNSHTLDPSTALPLLIDHPHLYLENGGGHPASLEKGQPVLSVRTDGDHVLVRLDPFPATARCLLQRQPANRLVLLEMNRYHRRISRILGPNGLRIPLAEKEKVFSAIATIRQHVDIRSDFKELALQQDEEQGNPETVVQLVPRQGGIEVSLYVRPFGDSGPYLHPGKGGELLIADIDGRQRQVRRDLAEEQAKAAAVLSSCLSLQNLERGVWNCQLPDTEECLQLLSELQQLETPVRVEWPEGKKWDVSPQLSFEQLYVKARRKNNWFLLEGELRINEDLVLDMRHLLHLLDAAPGRFLPLGRGQFLTLTTALRRRLEEIRAYAQEQDSELRIAAVCAPLMDEVLQEAGSFQADRDWLLLRERLHASAARPVPVPTTLQAELRGYQAEGYRWLCRLAAWGIGACLADDMGLGKTVQTIALLLQRAPEGPAMVVAPTSVCGNWLDELRRFAPTLRPMVLAGVNRGETIAGAAAFDVLLTSYGMMQQEIDLLRQRRWHTIVLDEAQAIKNLHTKRSRAAMALQGDFRMLTTGTPIENHLGEVWNLFHFINPGLLGTLAHFNARFAVPIERNGDAGARIRLKKLLRPFILRRIKAEVLDELPPKTEILVHVELSERERAFYEAIRQEAMTRIASAPALDARNHIRVLAELTRLRLASCHPRLVHRDIDLASSKLERFSEIAEDLRANKHKALVFSQFVGHLQLIAEFLGRHRIPFQYLDGSTPAPLRAERVKAFQAGNGDFFLISLKAGGMGLNLTAADFVIHMDPWWNPAVEDQASDRVHRIGQTRPVTIYRLIATGTVEEKIVRLHQDKKDLAEDLLEGSDVSARISAEELLELIRG